MSDASFAIRQITFDYGDFVMVGSTLALGFQRVDDLPGKTAYISAVAGKTARL